jgi:hypothetical protein
MNKNGSAKKERWNSRQASVVLDSLCVEIEPDEKFKNGEVVHEYNCVMQCKRCGATWKIDSINLKNGLVRIQAFIPWGLGYRFFFRCPNECNKAYKWKENIQWVSVLKEID